MVRGTPFKRAALASFEAAFDTSREDLALQSRGAFLKAFPLKRLQDLTIETYVIGLQSPYFVHMSKRRRDTGPRSKARPRSNSEYFGLRKPNPNKQYQSVPQVGTTAEGAFTAVKAALLNLVREGARTTPDFAAIDKNPLSQMFKAKILSLYFPERFLAVCSKDHLEVIGGEVGLPDTEWWSEIQSRLMDVKAGNPVTNAWSNPRFMRFLVDTYIPKKRKPPEEARKPRKKAHRKVNFEDIQNQRGVIGKRAEDFALKWEKDRLMGAGLEHLIDRIEDRRDRPGYGYDFLSHTTAKRPRFIEVKAVSKQGDLHRFFLSENEHTVSHSPEHHKAYYFYLVSFDGDGQPRELTPCPAASLYPAAEIAPASYTILVNLENSSSEK